MLRVVGGGEVEQAAIDLDGIDVFGTLVERLLHVIAAAGTDHEHVLGRCGRRSTFVDRVVDGFLGLIHLEPMGDAVHEDADAVGPEHGVARLVVRGPGHTGLRRLDAEGAEHGDERQAHQRQHPELPRTDRPEQDEGADRAPHDGLGADEGEDREDHDTDDAADEIELIGVEVGQLPEGAGDAVADAGQDRRHHDEDGRQQHLARRPVGLELAAEEDQVGADGLQRDGHEMHEQHEGTEHERREPQQGDLGATRPQETEPDPEERTEQHDVREVRQVDDTAAEPSDERQFHEQHEEREHHQPQPQCPGRGGRRGFR